MPRVPDYDRCYRLLDLPAGASLGEIEDSWRLHANAWHPDKFAGRLQEQATRKLQDINNARDDLRAYWRNYGKAPPTGAVNATETAPPRRQPPAPPPHTPPAKEPEKQPEKEPEKQPERKPEPEQKPPVRPSKPFGPPSFQKKLIHKFYDWADASHANNQMTVIILFPVMIFAIVMPAMLIVQGLASLTGSAVEGPYNLLLIALSIFNGVTLFRAGGADYDLYRIQEKPYLEMRMMSPKVVFERIARVLSGYKLNGYGWAIGDVARDPEDGTITLVSTMKIQNKIYHLIDAAYTVKLVVKVLDSGSDLCTVTYWFEVEAPLLWKVPVTTVVKETNAALVAAIH